MFSYRILTTLKSGQMWTSNVRNGWSAPSEPTFKSFSWSSGHGERRSDLVNLVAELFLWPNGWAKYWRFLTMESLNSFVPHTETQMPWGTGQIPAWDTWQKEKKLHRLEKRLLGLVLKRPLVKTPYIGDINVDKRVFYMFEVYFSPYYIWLVVFYTNLTAYSSTGLKPPTSLFCFGMGLSDASNGWFDLQLPAACGLQASRLVSSWLGRSSSAAWARTIAANLGGLAAGNGNGETGGWKTMLTDGFLSLRTGIPLGHFVDSVRAVVN